jgi:hypothetical protein
VAALYPAGRGPADDAPDAFATQLAANGINLVLAAKPSSPNCGATQRLT